MDIKPTKNFNLSKTSKRFLATITNPQLKGELKRGLIQAELHEAIQPKREKRPQHDSRATQVNTTPDSDSVE
jgi:hypothetical protein